VRYKIFLILLSLLLSACATSRIEPERSSKRIYIVKANDNFHSIAFAYEITTRQLQLANPGIDPLRLSVGQRLVIPGRNVESLGVTPASKGNFIWPLRRIDISSRFGNRNGRLHAGIDLRAPRETGIVASAAGRVKFSGRRNGYGLMLVIDHGAGVESAYAHNLQNIVQIGERVDQGQLIARVGRSGNASGYHVHFEIRIRGRAVNPEPYIKSGS